MNRIWKHFAHFALATMTTVMLLGLNAFAESEMMEYGMLARIVVYVLIAYNMIRAVLHGVEAFRATDDEPVIE